MKKAWKISSWFAAVICAVIIVFSSCAKKETLPVTSDSNTVMTQAQVGQAVDRVSGDQDLLRQALVLASNKGTLQQAISAAAEDSIIGIKMRSALEFGKPAKMPAMPVADKNTLPDTKAKRHPPMGTHTTTTTTSTNPLDKANSTIDNANQQVDKAGQVINKSKEVTKKAGDILNGTH